jgi:hypothetical protein
VLGVEGTVVVNGELALAIVADLGDLVRRRLLESLNNAVHYVNEHDFVARVVEELGNEATADVSTAKVNSLRVQSVGGAEQCVTGVLTFLS